MKIFPRFNCWHFNIYEQDKFHAQLSWAWKKFYKLEARLIRQDELIALITFEGILKNNISRKYDLKKEKPLYGNALCWGHSVSETQLSI